MKIKRFEDIVSWQKSKELVFKVYSLFSERKDLHKIIEKEFKNRLQFIRGNIQNTIKSNKNFMNFTNFLHLD